VKLRDILKSRNSEYHSKFIHIEDNAKKIMPNSRVFFPTFTNHDIAHLESVEKIIDELLEEKIINTFSDEEIFCLLSAVWLHDIGMIPINNEKQEFEGKTKQEREEFRTFVRDNHHIRSKHYIKEHENDLYLTELESKAIGNICKGHRSIDLNNLNNVPSRTDIRVGPLAALLRLADECDISEDRESSLSNEGIDEDVLQEHYKIHNIVHSLQFNHNSNNILIKAQISEENDIQILSDRKDKIYGELLNVKPFLRKIQVYLDNVELKVTVNSNMIQKMIILSIVQDNDIYELEEDYITSDDIEEELEELIISNIVIRNPLSLTEDIDHFKKIFELFSGRDMKKFFFTDYVKRMIPKCFREIENNFNVDLELKDEPLRIKILMNSPTALHFLLFMDEIIKTPNFNISSNQNGVLMFDSILAFGLFNDMYHYADKIDFELIEQIFKEFKFFDEEYVLSRVRGCKLLRDD